MTNINDAVELIHCSLLENGEYRMYLEALWDSDAIEGSLIADDHQAARMLRDTARTVPGNAIGGTKIHSIVTALHVVLRRAGMSREQRRRRVVPPDVQGQDWVIKDFVS